jgi:hypothetical protein
MHDGHDVSTGMKATEPGVSHLVEISNHIFTVMHKWFRTNILTLNVYKTNFIKFVTNIKPVTNMQIVTMINTQNTHTRSENKRDAWSTNDNCLHWESHI